MASRDSSVMNAPSIDRGRVFKDFTAGMENVPDVSAIQDNALAEIINMELDASGALVSRPPYVKLNNTPVGGQAIEFLGYFNRADGTTFAVVATTTQTRLYLVCRTQAGGWWGETTPGSGTYTFQSLSGGVKPMPKGDQIALFKERLFIAGWGDSDERTKVYLSEVTNTTGGDINNWPP